MNKIKKLSAFLESNGNYAQSEILKIIYATTKDTFSYTNEDGTPITVDIYHEIEGGLSLNKILEMEKGCFGAYFANQSGFADSLSDIEEYINDHEDKESLHKEVSQMSGENTGEQEPKSFMDRMKDMGSSAVESIRGAANNVVRASKKKILKSFMDAPLSRIIGSPTTRMILGNFVEGINDEDEELDGIAIFGSESIYVVMGIQKFNKSAEIYDMCAPGRATGKAEEYFLKCLELCHELGIENIEMSTRGSTSNAMLKYMKACMEAEMIGDNEVSQDSIDKILSLNPNAGENISEEERARLTKSIIKRKGQRDKYGLSIDIDDEYPDYYLTKLKDEYKGVDLSEEEVMANPQKYFEHEPYYDTTISLSKSKDWNTLQIGT